MSLAKFRALIEYSSSARGLARIRTITVQPGRQKRGASWLLDRIHDDFPDLNDCFSTMKCLAELVVKYVDTTQLIDELMPRIRIIAKTYFTETNQLNDTGRVNALSQWFTLIHSEMPEGPVRDHMKSVNRATGIEKQLKTDAARDAVIEKNKHPVELHWAQVSAVILRSIESPIWYDKVIAVGLAIGARSIEIMNKHVSTFSEAVDETGNVMVNYIRQTGVAKDPNEEQERVIQKPILLLSFRQVMDAINEVRDHVGINADGMTNKQLASSYNAAISAKQKTNFPAAWKRRGRLGSHFSREVYANVSYEVLDHPPMSKNAWVASVLGHKTSSIATSLSYTGVVVAKDVGPTGRRQDAVITSLQQQIEELKKRGSGNVTVKRDEVVFFNESGHSVVLKKMKRKRGQTEEETRKRVREAEELLAENDVKINHDNLRSMGIGAVAVSKFKTDRSDIGNVRRSNFNQGSEIKEDQ